MLKNYDKDHIPENLIRKLKHYVNKPDFKPDIVGGKAKAAKSLCMWCLAMFKYHEVIKIVNPKREAVRVIQAKLEEDRQKMIEKEAELQAVTDRVAQLQADGEETAAKAKQLEFDIKQTEARLGRAELLIDLLADEGVRWDETLQHLTTQEEYILGDVFLSSM